MEHRSNKHFHTRSENKEFTTYFHSLYQNIFPLANTFAKRENVRPGQSPTGTQMVSITGFSSLTTSNTKILVWRDGQDAPVYITQPEDLSKLGLVPDYKALGLI